MSGLARTDCDHGLGIWFSLLYVDRYKVSTPLLFQCV
jgi:hypothetical protein